MIYSIDGTSPRIVETAWVAPGCHIIGRVTLSAHSSVWFGTVIRGDNEAIVLGEGSNIQENSVLHTDPGCPITIGAGCTIGHKAMLHGCTIGDNSLIGMGATVLNRAVIGRNCLIGAGGPDPRRQGDPRRLARHRCAGQGHPHARRGGHRKAAGLGPELPK